MAKRKDKLPTIPKEQTSSDLITPAANSGVFVDFQKYEHLLEDEDITPEQKQEFLQLIWNIVCDMVSLGFGMHPAQQVCGQVSNTKLSATSKTQFPVYCEDALLTNAFNETSDLIADSDEKGVTK